MTQVEVLQDHTWNGVARSAGSTYEITTDDEHDHPGIVDTVVALGYVRIVEAKTPTPLRDETAARRKALDDEAAARPGVTPKTARK